MATIDIANAFTLTNSYTGPTKLLAISTSDSQTPQLLAHPDTNSSPPPNAQWFLTVTDAPPFYHLHTQSTGPSKALDVLNDNGANSVLLRMSDTGVYVGQYWRFDVWPDAATDGYVYRLSNNYTGETMHLDVYSDTLGPHLAGGTAAGQYWRMGVVGNGKAAGGSATTGGSTTATATATATAGGDSKPTTTTGSASGQSELSTGAIAGIAIGSVAALSILIGVVAYMLVGAARRKRRLRSRDMNEPFLEAKSDAGEGRSSGPPPGYERVVALRQAAPVELSAGQLQAAELSAVPMQPQELPGQRY